MRRSGKTLLSLAFIALLAGCQPVDSFQPLYQEKDLVFDPGLLGKWTEDGGTLEFLQAGDHGYDVIFTDDNPPHERMVMDGRLVSLEGHRFLDLTPKKLMGSPDSYRLNIEQGKNGSRVTPTLVHAGDGAYIEFLERNTTAKGAPVEMRLRLAHWFFRITNDDNNLKLDYIDDDHLGKTLEQKNIHIAHVLVGPARKSGETDNRQLVLTAKTTDLQKFVLDHVNDDQVFTDSIKFQRSAQPSALSIQPKNLTSCGNDCSSSDHPVTRSRRGCLHLRKCFFG